LGVIEQEPGYVRRHSPYTRDPTRSALEGLLDRVVAGCGRGVRVLPPELGRRQPVRVLEGPVEVGWIGVPPPGTDRRDRPAEQGGVEQVPAGAVEAPTPDETSDAVAGVLEQP